MTDFEPIARFGLMLARPGALVMMAPAFGGTYAPAHLRIALTMLLAFTLMPVTAISVPPTTAGIGLVMFRELAIGFAFALAIRALLAGAELGGQLCGMQLMLSYGSVVDPQGGVRNNVLGNLYSNLALLTFFLINGHHTFIRNMAASYGALPIGGGGLNGSIVQSASQMLGVVFVLGLRLAAPLIVVMLVLELATGIVARTAPAINLMVVGTPLRLVVGLLVVAALVPVLPNLVVRFTAVVAPLAVQAARALR